MPESAGTRFAPSKGYTQNYSMVEVGRNLWSHQGPPGPTPLLKQVARDYVLMVLEELQGARLHNTIYPC